MQTGKLVADGPITALSWNLEGTRLLTGGKILQLWHQASLYQDDSQRKRFDFRFVGDHVGTIK